MSSSAQKNERVRLSSNEQEPLAGDKSITVRSLLKSTGLYDYMLMPGVTEVAVNRPGEILTESSEGWKSYLDARCTFDELSKFANALAIFNKGYLSAEAPIISVTLPDGERGQIVIPPACEKNTISLTIRRPSHTRFSLADYVSSQRLSGFRDASRHIHIPDHIPINDWQRTLVDYKNTGDMDAFFRLAVEKKLNIVLVGGTGSGKTTFTKAIADLVDKNTRIFTIEDTHELSLPHHPNRVHLFFGDHVTSKQVVSSCMRMKPDRIFLTELRGDETWDYISLLNTGHPGSITTVHANDCRSAYNRIATLIKQSEVGQSLAFDYILREVMTTLDVLAFFDRTYMTEIYYDPALKWKLQNGMDDA